MKQIRVFPAFLLRSAVTAAVRNLSFGLAILVLAAVPVAVRAQDDGLFQTMKRERDALQKQVQDVKKQVQQQQKAMAALERTNAELKQDIGRLNDELEDVGEASAALQQRIDAAEAREQQALDMVEKERERARRLADIIKELRTLIAAQAGAVDAQKTEMRKLEGQVGEVQSELAQARQAATAAERRIEQAQMTARQETERAQQDRADMHYNLGVVYANHRMYDAAEREFLQSLTFAPDAADAHYNLGVIYDEALRQPEKAAEHFRQYLELNPNGEDAPRVREWIAELEGSAS